MNNWNTENFREKSNADKFVPILSKEQEEELFGEFLRRKKYQDETQMDMIGFIWIDGAGCGGEPAVIMEIERVYPLRCIYMPLVMNGVGFVGGENTEAIFKNGEKYFLLVSGNISFGRGEMETRYNGKILTSWEVIEKLAAEAVQVILLGDCACKALKKRVKDALVIPGCPVKSEHLEMVFKEMTHGIPLKMGEDGLPVWYEKQNAGVVRNKNYKHSVKKQRHFVRRW